MKDDKKQAAKLTELLKGAEDHPLMKQILAEKAAAILAERTEAANQIKAIQKEQFLALPKLQADIEAADAKLKQAKVIFEEAGRSLQVARAALSVVNNDFYYTISHLEQDLIKSADPQIDEGIDFFREKLAWLRSPGKIEMHRLGAERDIFTETVKVKCDTTHPAILEAIDYCRDALTFLELLKLMPEFDIQVIEAMKKKIPDIYIFTESEGEKPMEGSRPRSIASYFDSADLTDYKVKKLLEKADKSLATKRARG